MIWAYYKEETTMAIKLSIYRRTVAFTLVATTTMNAKIRVYVGHGILGFYRKFVETLCVSTYLGLPLRDYR